MRKNTLAKFSRQDIIDAYYVLEVHYHESGILQERPSNWRRRMSTDVQIRRMEVAFCAAYDVARQLVSKPARDDWKLTPNAKAIYRHLEHRYGFDAYS